MYSSLCAALLLLGYVQAHTNSLHDLAGTTLCLDSRSVQVSVDAADLFPALPGNAALKAQLEARLIAILQDYEIPFRAQQECTGNSFLLSRFTGEPSDFAGDASYVFEAITRVGLAASVAQQDDTAAMPASSLYDAYASWLLFEDELTEPELFLPVANEQMMRDLAIDWWEDNPVVQRSFPWVQWSGIAVTLLVVVTGLYLYRRKPQALKP